METINVNFTSRTQLLHSITAHWMLNIIWWSVWLGHVVKNFGMMRGLLYYTRCRMWQLESFHPSWISNRDG